MAVVVAPGTSAAAQPLLSGTALDQLGRPDTNMTVTLEAWPNGATTDKIPNGGTIPVKTLQVVRPSAAGAYSFNPDLTKLPASYLSPSGVANLNVVVDDASDLGQESFAVPAAKAGPPPYRTRSSRRRTSGRRSSTSASRAPRCRPRSGPQR